MGFDASPVMWTDRCLLEVGERLAIPCPVSDAAPHHRPPAANGPNLAVYPAGLEVQHPKNNQSSLTDKISLFSCGAK